MAEDVRQTRKEEGAMVVARRGWFIGVYRLETCSFVLLPLEDSTCQTDQSGFKAWQNF